MPKPFVECFIYLSPLSFIHTVHVSKWEGGKCCLVYPHHNDIAWGYLSLFINMLCDGKDAIHMCTKFDVCSTISKFGRNMSEAIC